MSYVRNLQTNKKQKKNNNFDKIMKWFLLCIVLFVIFLIVASFAMIIIRGLLDVSKDDANASLGEVLFGSKFNMNDSLAMGILVVNTLWMSFLVLLIAVPISVCTALLITKMLNKTASNIMIAIVSILAAIPSVIYGAFGKYFLLKFLAILGLAPNETTPILLSVLLIVSVMVMPTITLMAITSINLADKKMEDSSEALGATRMQTSLFITLRSAKTGIIVGCLFALGRVIGEATAISMLSGNNINQEGITFGLFQPSLFMSPVIMSALAGSSDRDGAQFAYTVLSAILLMTIICVFLFAKFVENKTDDQLKSKRTSSKLVEQKNIIEKVKFEGDDKLSKSEKRNYSNYLRNYFNGKFNERFYEKKDNSHVLQKTSLDESIKFYRYKKSKTNIYKTAIILFSMFGVIALLSISLFLLNTDLSLLFNKEYLTSRGKLYGSELGSDYLGIGLAMFGTMFTMLVVILVALPIGIAIAIYTKSYLEKGTKTSNAISFAFQIMTSIPAVIYGSLAIIIFSQTGWIRTNALSFVPIIMLIIVILPTIIKQTQEGFNAVKENQIEGSYALGGTKSYTSRRVVVVQALPAILSAAILGLAIVMADSAIMITILNQPGTPSTPGLWISDGGYTLSSLIYWLSNMASSNVIGSRKAAIDQMKVIGIILMILIFWLSMISQKVKSKENKGASIMSIGVIMYMLSFWLFGGSLIVMYISPIIGIFGMFWEKIFKESKNER